MLQCPPLPEINKSFLPKEAQHKVLGFNHKHGLLKAAEISSTLRLDITHGFFSTITTPSIGGTQLLIILQSFHNAF
jgi:hypothetical protein